MSGTWGFTRKLAQLITTRSMAIPERATRLAKAHLLDTFGVAIAGLNSRTGKLMIARIRRQGGNPEATVIGTNIRCSAETAALVNATLAHAREHPLDRDELMAKIADCCEFGSGPEDVSPLITAVLDKFESAGDVKAVAQLVSGQR